MTRLAVFDFDGTICDTWLDCAVCFNEALRSCGFPEKPVEFFRPLFGATLNAVVTGVLPEEAQTEENIKAVGDAYRKIYAAYEKPTSRPYPGVPEALQAIREKGVLLAVHSNKRKELLTGMVEKIFPAGLFDAVIGASDAYPPKPAPDAVEALLKRFGVKKEDAVYVGDGMNDIQTAKSAGLPVILVTWGLGTEEVRTSKDVFRKAETAKEMERFVLEAESEKILDRVHRINLETLKAVDRIAKAHGITYYLCFGGLLGALRHRDFIPWDNDVDVVITRAEVDRLKPFLLKELDPEKYELVMPEDYGDRYLDMVPRVNYKLADIHAFSEEANAYYCGKMNKIALDFFFFDRIPETPGGKWTVFRLKLLYGLLNAKRFDLSTGQYPNGFYRLAAKALRLLGKGCNTDKLRKKTAELANRYNADETIPYYRLTNDTLHSFTFRVPASYFDGTVPVPIGEDTFPGPKEPDLFLRLWYGNYMEFPPEEERIPHVFNKLLTADLFTFYKDPALGDR